MSADDLWCSWCRQPHAPCATTPAMEAERAATLRARLEKRYESSLPRREWVVCDGLTVWNGEEWTDRGGERVYRLWATAEREVDRITLNDLSVTRARVCERITNPDGTVRYDDGMRADTSRPERPCTYDPADEEPEAEPVAIHNPDPGYFGVTEWSGGTDPSIVGMAYRNAVEEGPPPVPALGYVLGARLENIDSSIVPPDGTIMDLDGHRVVARNGEWHGHHLGVLGYSELHPDRVVVFVPDTDPLRSYLRTLTNPDAPAEDVAAALALLTDEDRELVAALTKRNP